MQIPHGICPQFAGPFQQIAAGHPDSRLKTFLLTRGVRMFWYLAIIACFWANDINGTGTDNLLCEVTAQNSEFSFYDYSFPGTTVLELPYRWCKTFCSGWSRFPSSDIDLVLLQFILPTVIFALVIPRKWHLYKLKFIYCERLNLIITRINLIYIFIIILFIF